MSERLLLTGNHAAAHGARLSRAQVISAYPITPQTTIVEELSEMVATGRLPGQVHHGRVGALGHGRLRGGRGGRGPHLHRHLGPGPGAHARDAALGGGGPPAHRAEQRDPGHGPGVVDLERADRLPLRSATWAG